MPRGGLKHIPLIFALIFTLILFNNFGLTKVINTEFQVLLSTATFFVVVSVVVYFLSWVRGHNPQRGDLAYPRRYTLFKSLDFLNKDLLRNPSALTIGYMREELDRYEKVVSAKPELK